MKRICFFCFLYSLGFLVNAQQLTNIPTFRIATRDQAPILDKKTWVEGSLTIESEDSDESVSDLVLEIRGRGNSTWGMEKKPYRIKLDKKKQLLNLPAKEKNWVLLANYADKTLIRNALAFEISDFLGFEYTPSVRFVDLLLNGQFLGNYMVTDQTEVADFRVPVEKQAETDVDLPQISGGYLLEVDGFADSEPVWFKTGKNVKITIKYPKDDEINEFQRSYISNYVKQAEDVLFSSFKEEGGYESFFDIESVINWYLASELTGNSDACWSTYFYKKRGDDKLYFGPLWDYDIAFNNDRRLGDATRKLMLDAGHGTDLTKVWIKRFFEDETFHERVKKRWTQLVDQQIELHLQNYIDSLATLLNESQQQNFYKWKILNKIVYQELEARGTYEAEIDFIKTYITQRIAFLNERYYDAQYSGAEKMVVPDNRLLVKYDAGNRSLLVNTEKIAPLSAFVYGIDGRLILQYASGQEETPKHEIRIPLTGIAPGIYIVTATIGDCTTQSFKVLID